MHDGFVAPRDEACPLPNDGWISGHAEIDEMQAMLFESSVANDRVAPLRIASIDHDVSGFEFVRERLEHPVGESIVGDEEKSNAGRSEEAANLTDPLQGLEPHSLQIGINGPVVDAVEEISLFERQSREGAAVFAKSNHREVKRIGHTHLPLGPPHGGRDLIVSSNTTRSRVSLSHHGAVSEKAF